MKFGFLLLLALSLLAGACSKNRSWEEEVMLNTGEKVWVKRSQSYSLTGGAGNPADLAYRPDTDSQLEFDWRGTHYRYLGDANVMLLAISPSGVPVLVADAAGNSWNWRHNYRCTQPFYVQLIPGPSGDSWTWPTRVESWLYGMPANLFVSFGDPGEVRSRYLIEDKKRQPYLFDPRLRTAQMVDPEYVGDMCKREGGSK